jgi:hypothetical protein
MGEGGLCRYFIVSFYYLMFCFYGFVFLTRCYPYLEYYYPDTYHIHKFFLVFLVPWPWVMVVALHWSDPGRITPENVESYLQAYPYDNVLYGRTICDTLKIPAPARSRYCRFTNQRIAYF